MQLYYVNRSKPTKSHKHIFCNGYVILPHFKNCLVAVRPGFWWFKNLKKVAWKSVQMTAKLPQLCLLCVLKPDPLWQHRGEAPWMTLRGFLI